MPALVFPAPGSLSGTRYQFNFTSFDVAPITGAAVKNLLLQSQSITTAPWINGPFRIVNDYLFDIAQPDSTVKFYTNDTGISTPSNPSVIGSGNATAIVSSSINQFFGQQVNVRPSTTYTFSFYALRGTATDVTYGIYDLNNIADLVAPTSYYSSINGSTWTRVQFTFTTKSNTEKIILYPLYNISAGQTPGTNYLTAFQLEPGSSASTYQPTADTLYTTENARVNRVVSKLNTVNRVKSPAVTPAPVSKLSTPLIRFRPPISSSASIAKLKAPIIVRRALPESIIDTVSLSRYDNQGYTDNSFTTSTVSILSIGNSGTSTYQTNLTNTLNYVYDFEPWRQPTYVTADLVFNTQTNIVVNLALSPFGVGGYVSVSNSATGVANVFRVISKVASNIVKIESSSTYDLGQVRLGSTITYISPSVAQRSQILASTINLQKTVSYSPIQRSVLAEYAQYRLSPVIYDPIPGTRDLTQTVANNTNTFLSRFDNQGIIDTTVPSKILSTVVIPEIVNKNITIFNDYITESEPFTQLNYARLIFSPSGTFAAVAQGQTNFFGLQGATDVTTFWTVPDGVTKISFFAVGPGGNSQNASTGGQFGGSGGGGSLYVNDLWVVPGSTVTVSIASTSTISPGVKQGDTVITYNGKQYIAGGGYSGNLRTGGAQGIGTWTGTAGVDFASAVAGAGGVGGSFLGTGSPYGAGGGGAAGYGSSGSFGGGGNSSGSGATTGAGGGGESAAGQPGGGGGAKDAANGGGGNGSGGGGVGIFGRTTAGAGGTSGTSGTSAGGGGGSGGESIGANTPRGGDYGGGAAAAGGYGGRGAVRFVWSTAATRVYPVTNIGDLTVTNNYSITFPSVPAFAQGGWINAFDSTTGLNQNFQVAEYNNSYQYNSLLIASSSTINTILFTTATVIKSVSPAVRSNSQLLNTIIANSSQRTLAGYEKYILGDIMPWLIKDKVTTLSIVETGIIGFAKNINADKITKVEYDATSVYDWKTAVGKVRRDSPIGTVFSVQPAPKSTATSVTTLKTIKYITASAYDWKNRVYKVARYFDSPFGRLFTVQPIPKSTATSVPILSKQVWRNTGFITTSTTIAPLERYDNVKGLTDSSFTTGTVYVSFLTTASSITINGYTTSTVNSTLTNFVTLYYPTTIVSNNNGPLPAFPAGSLVRLTDLNSGLGTPVYQVLDKSNAFSNVLVGYGVSLPGNRYSLIAYNANHQLGSGNFTMEAWIFPTTTGVVRGIVQTWFIGGQFILDVTSGNVLRFTYYNPSDLKEIYVGTQTISPNIWTHVAVVRTGSQLKFYVNGVGDTTTYNITTALAYFQGTTKPIAIGTGEDYTGTFTGSISQLRIVKGVAVYSGNFTLPVRSLTATQSADVNISAITGSQTLLLWGHTNTLIDGSNYNWTLTAGGAQPAPTVVSGVGNYPPTIRIWQTPASGGLDTITIGSPTAFSTATITTGTSILSVSPSIMAQSQILNYVLGLRPRLPSGYSPIERLLLGQYAPSYLYALTEKFDIPFQYGPTQGKIRSTIPLKTPPREASVTPMSKYRNYLFTSTNVITVTNSYPTAWQTVNQYSVQNEITEILLPSSYTQRYLLLPQITGQAEWTTAGTYSWTCPPGVFSVSAVCVGAGGSGSSDGMGGGGGGLGYKNAIPVIPGQTYTVVVGAGHTPASLAGNGVTGGDSYFISITTVKGGGGTGGGIAGNTNATGGTFVGDGGGNGGIGGRKQTTLGGAGGGGAGGYSGTGGNGNDYYFGATSGGSVGINGSGGGGGGGGVAFGDTNGNGNFVSAGAGGGGVGIYGQGQNGIGGQNSNLTAFITGGSGGSGGTNGANGTQVTFLAGVTGGSGGGFGGGGGGGTWSGSGGPYPNGKGGPSRGGAVRILWGPQRAFPISYAYDITDASASYPGLVPGNEVLFSNSLINFRATILSSDFASSFPGYARFLYETTSTDAPSTLNDGWTIQAYSPDFIDKNLVSSINRFKKYSDLDYTYPWNLFYLSTEPFGKTRSTRFFIDRNMGNTPVINNFDKLSTYNNVGLTTGVPKTITRVKDLYPVAGVGNISTSNFITTYIDEKDILLQTTTTSSTITYYFAPQDDIPFPAGSTVEVRNSNFLFTPLAGRGSVEFAGGYVSIPQSTEFEFFAFDDFTIEMWVYPRSYNGYNIVGPSLFGTINGDLSGYSINLGTDIDTFRIIGDATGEYGDILYAGLGNGPALNTWSHIALTRAGDKLSLWKNGVELSYVNGADIWNFVGQYEALVGRFYDGGYDRYFDGYISNLRIVKGTALYTTMFSPSTIPFEIVANTSLLALKGNSYVDEGPNNFTIIPNNGQAVELHNIRINSTSTSVTTFTDDRTDIVQLGAATMTEIFNNGYPGIYNTDDWYYDLTLPFNIQFKGTTYSTAAVLTNSGIQFGGTYDPSNWYDGIDYDMPDISWAPNPAGPSLLGIPGLYISSYNNNTYKIYVKTEGTTPNRTFRVRYEGYGFIYDPVTPTQVWEIVFYENNPGIYDIVVVLDNRGTNGATGATNGTSWMNSGNIRTPFVSTPYNVTTTGTTYIQTLVSPFPPPIPQYGYYYKYLSTTGTNYSVTINRPQVYPTGSSTLLSKPGGQPITLEFTPTGSSIPYPTNSWIKLAFTNTNVTYTLPVISGNANSVTVIKPDDHLEIYSNSSNIVSASIDVYPQIINPSTTNTSTARQNFFFFNVAPGIKGGRVPATPGTPLEPKYLFSAKVSIPTRFAVPDTVQVLKPAVVRPLNFIRLPYNEQLIKTGKVQIISTFRTPLSVEYNKIARTSFPINLIRPPYVATPTITNSTTTSRLIFDEPTPVSGRTGSTSTAVAWWINESDVLTTYSTSTAFVTLFFNRPNRNFNYTKVNLLQSAANYNRVFDVINYSTSSVTISDPGDLPSVSELFARMGQLTTSTDYSTVIPSTTIPFRFIVGTTEIKSLPANSFYKFIPFKLQDVTNLSINKTIRHSTFDNVGFTTGTNITITGVDDFVYATGRSAQYTSNIVEEYIYDYNVTIQTLVTSTSVTLYFPAVEYNYFPAGNTVNLTASYNLLDASGFYNSLVTVTTSTVNSITFNDPGDLPVSPYISINKIAGSLVTAKFAQNGSVVPFASSSTIRITNSVTTQVMNANVSYGLYNLVTFVKTTNFFDFTSLVTSIISTSVPLIPQISVRPILPPVNARENLFYGEMAIGTRLSLTRNYGITPTGINNTNNLTADNINKDSFKLRDLINYRSLAKLQAIASNVKEPILNRLASYSLQRPITLVKDNTINYQLTHLQKQLFQLRAERTDPIITTTSTSSRSLFEVVPNYVSGRTGSTATTVSWFINEDEILKTYTISTATVTLYFPPAKNYNWTLVRLRKQTEVSFYEDTFNIISRTIDSVTILDPGNLPNISSMEAYLGQTITSIDSAFKYPNYTYRFEKFKPYGPIVGTQVFSLPPTMAKLIAAAQVRAETSKFRADAIKAIASPVKDIKSVVRADVLQKQLFKLNDVKKYETTTSSTNVTSILYDNIPAQITGRSGTSNNLVDYFYDNTDLYQQYALDKLTSEDESFLFLENGTDILSVDTAGSILKLLFGAPRTNRTYPYTKVRLIQTSANFDQVVDILTYTDSYVVVRDIPTLPSISGMIAYFGYENTIVNTTTFVPTTVTPVEKLKIPATSIFLKIPAVEKLTAMQVLRGDKIRFLTSNTRSVTTLVGGVQNLKLSVETEFIAQSSVSALNPRTSGGVPRVSLYWATIAQGLRTKLYLQPIVTHNPTVAMSDIVETTNTVVSTTSTLVTNFTGPLTAVSGRNPLRGNNIVAAYLALDTISENIYITNAISTSTVTLYFAPSRYPASGDKIKISQPDPDGIFYEQIVSVTSFTNDSVTFNDPGNIPSTSGLFIQWGRTITEPVTTYATRATSVLTQVNELEKRLFKLNEIVPKDTFRVVNVDQRPKLKDDSIRLKVDKMQSMQVVRPAYNEIRLGRDLIEKLKVPTANTRVFDTPKITPGRQTEYLREDPTEKRWIQPYMKFGLVVKQISKSTFISEQLQRQLFKLTPDRKLNAFTADRVSTLDRLKEPTFNLRYESLDKPINKLFSDRTGFGVGNPQIEKLRIYKLDLTEIFETPKSGNLAKDSFKLIGERIVFKTEKLNTLDKLVDGQNNIKAEYLQKQLFQLRPDRGNATLVSSTVTSRVIYDNLPTDISGVTEHTADTVTWFMDNTDILHVTQNTGTNVVLYFAVPRTNKNYAFTKVRVTQPNAFYDREFNVVSYTTSTVTIQKPDWLPSVSGMQAYLGHTINEVVYRNVPPTSAPMVNRFTAVSGNNKIFEIETARLFREQLGLRTPVSVVRVDKLTTQDILRTPASTIKTDIVKTPLFVKDTFTNKLDLLAKVKTVASLREEKVRRTLTSTTASNYTYFDNLPVRVVGRSGYITNTVDWFMDTDNILRVIPSGSSIVTLYFNEARLFDYKLIRVLQEIEGGIYDQTYNIISYTSNSASFIDPNNLPSTSGMRAYLGQTVSVTQTISVPPSNGVDAIIKQKVFARDIHVVGTVNFANLNKQLFGLKETPVVLYAGNTRSISKLVDTKVSRTSISTTSTSRIIYDNVPTDISGRDGFTTNTITWFMDDAYVLQVLPLGSSLIKLYFSTPRIGRNYAYTSVRITQPNAFYDRTFQVIDYTDSYVTITAPDWLPSTSGMQAYFGHTINETVTTTVPLNASEYINKLKVSYKDVNFFDIRSPYYGTRLFNLVGEKQATFNVTPKLTSAQVLRDLRNNILTGKVTSVSKMVEARAKIASESLAKQLMQVRADKVDTFNRITPTNLLEKLIVTKLDLPQVFFTPSADRFELRTKLNEPRSRLIIGKVSTVSSLFETRTRLAIENISKRLFSLTDVRKDKILTVNLLNKFIGTANNNQVFYTPRLSKLSAMQVLRGDNIRRTIADRLMAAVVVRGESSRFRTTTINKPITRLVTDGLGTLRTNLTHLRHIQDTIFIGAPTYTVTATTEIPQRQVTGRNDTVFENIVQYSLDLGLVNVIQSTPTPNTTATLYFAPTGTVVPYAAGSYVTLVSTALYPIYQRNVQVTTSTNTSISFVEPGDLPSISTLSIYKGQSEFITLSFVPQNITKPAYPEGSSIQIRNTVTNTAVFAQVISATTGSVTIIKPAEWIDTTALPTSISIASGELFPRTSVRTNQAPKNARESLYYFEMAPGLRYNLSIQQALAFARDQDLPLPSNLSPFNNVGLTEGPTVNVLVTTDPILSVTGRSNQFSTNLLQYFFDDANILTITTLPPQATVTLSFYNALNVIPYPSGTYVTLRSNETPYETAGYERVVQVLVGTQGEITISDPGDLPSISKLTIQSKDIKDVTVYFSPISGTTKLPFAVGTYIKLTNTLTGSAVTAPVTATGQNFVTFTKPIEELYSSIGTQIISASVSVIPTTSVRTILPPVNPRERLFYAQMAGGYRNNSSIQQAISFGKVFDQLEKLTFIPRVSPIIRMYTYNTVKIELGKLNSVYEKFRAVEESHNLLTFLAKRPTPVKNPDSLGLLLLPVGGFRSIKFGVFAGKFEDLQIFLGVSRGLVGRLRAGDFAPGNRGFKDVAAPRKEPIQFWN